MLIDIMPGPSGQFCHKQGQSSFSIVAVRPFRPFAQHNLRMHNGRTSVLIPSTTTVGAPQKCILAQSHVLWTSRRSCFLQVPFFAYKCRQRHLETIGLITISGIFLLKYFRCETILHFYLIPFHIIRYTVCICMECTYIYIELYTIIIVVIMIIILIMMITIMIIMIIMMILIIMIIMIIMTIMIIMIIMIIIRFQKVASRFVSIMPIWQMVNRILTRLEPRSLDAWEVLDVERDGGMPSFLCFMFSGGMKVLGISNRPINWEMSIQSSCSVPAIAIDARVVLTCLLSLLQN